MLFRSHGIGNQTGVYGTGGTYGIRGSPFGAGYAGYFDGKVHVQGNFTASGTKTFVQPHPSDPEKELVYVALEGREIRVFFDGTATLQKGEATVSVPEDFRLVASKENLNVILTPFGETEGLYVAKRSLDEIVVKERSKGESNISFGFLVIGTRKGFEVARPIQENAHFRPDEVTTKEEFENQFDVQDGEDYYSTLSKKLSWDLLISNGTLLPDGKVNPKTASHLGWNFSKKLSKSEKEVNLK